MEKKHVIGKILDNIVLFLPIPSNCCMKVGRYHILSYGTVPRYLCHLKRSASCPKKSGLWFCVFRRNSLFLLIFLLIHSKYFQWVSEWGREEAALGTGCPHNQGREDGKSSARHHLSIAYTYLRGHPPLPSRSALHLYIVGRYGTVRYGRYLGTY